jgi:hypothetical protein
MKLRLALAGIVLALTLCIAVLCSRPRSSITHEAYQQIEIGMSRQQVYELLGGPPRSETERRMSFAGGLGSLVRPADWWGPTIHIRVIFDEQEMVSGKWVENHNYAPVKKPSLWEEACSWLPW